MRFKLECGESLKPWDLVNGVVLGVLGKEENGGKFMVDAAGGEVHLGTGRARGADSVSRSGAYSTVDSKKYY